MPLASSTGISPTGVAHLLSWAFARRIDFGVFDQVNLACGSLPSWQGGIAELAVHCRLSPFSLNFLSQFLTFVNQSSSLPNVSQSGSKLIGEWSLQIRKACGFCHTQLRVGHLNHVQEIYLNALYITVPNKVHEDLLGLPSYYIYSSHCLPPFPLVIHDSYLKD